MENKNQKILALVRSRGSQAFLKTHSHPSIIGQYAERRKSMLFNSGIRFDGIKVLFTLSCHNASASNNLPPASSIGLFWSSIFPCSGCLSQKPGRLARMACLTWICLDCRTRYWLCTVPVSRGHGLLLKDKLNSRWPYMALDFSPGSFFKFSSGARKRHFHL